jgi:methylmalonyl-CoA mutase
VNNPADGSYYIETLTSQLAEKALCCSKTSRLQVVSKQLNEGVIKRKIQESADKEQELLIQERSVVGDQ